MSWQRLGAGLALLFLAAFPLRAQHADFGRALFARGLARACWYGQPGLTPRTGLFRPDQPIVRALPAEQDARYGAGAGAHTGWRVEEQATRISQIAERVVRHPSNPYGITGNATWKLGIQDTLDLFAICGAFEELDAMDARLFPESPVRPECPPAPVCPTCPPERICPPPQPCPECPACPSCPRPTLTAPARETLEAIDTWRTIGPGRRAKIVQLVAELKALLAPPPPEPSTGRFGEVTVVPASRP